MSKRYDDESLLKTVLEGGDDHHGNDGFSGDEFFGEEVRNAAFRVRIAPLRLFANVIVLVIPFVGYYLARPLLLTFDAVGFDGINNMFFFVMALILVIGLALLFSNTGKGLIVSGRGIIIKTFFFLHEAINVSDVTECEVITGLSVYTRYGTQHFSKAIIRYGASSKVSFNSNMYRGWDELVRYMEQCGKLRYTDGRGAVEKKLDDIFKR